MARKFVISVCCVAVVAAAFGFWTPTLRAHGGTVEARVESVVFRAADRYTAIYAVGLKFEDGDAYTAADVTVRVRDTAGFAIAQEAAPHIAEGVYVAEVDLPDDHSWQVQIEFDGPDGAGELRFEAHPHHAETGAGPFIRLSTEEGTELGEPATASLFDTAGVGLPVPPSTTAPPAPPSTTDGSATVEPPADTSNTVTFETMEPGTGHASSAEVGASAEPEVVVRIEGTPLATEIRRNVAVRLVHIAAISMWVGGVVAFCVGHRGRLWRLAAYGGMAVTMASGIGLLLFGTPLGFPGFFRWSELRAVPYGIPYSTAVVVKLVMVAVAVPIGMLAGRRRSRSTLIVFLALVSGAVVALTVASQLHLFVHG